MSEALNLRAWPQQFGVCWIFRGQGGCSHLHCHTVHSSRPFWKWVESFEVFLKNVYPLLDHIPVLVLYVLCICPAARTRTFVPEKCCSTHPCMAPSPDTNSPWLTLQPSSYWCLKHTLASSLLSFYSIAAAWTENETLKPVTFPPLCPLLTDSNE